MRILFLGALCGFAVLRHSKEKTEKHESSDCGGDDIRHRLCKEHGKGFVCKEMRQDKDHGDQEENLPQQCHNKRNFGLTKSHEGLLAGDLEAYREAQGKKDFDSPRGVTHQCPIAGKDSGEEVWEPLKTPFRRNVGSFVPTYAYKNLEIHPVCLQFLTHHLEQNFSPLAQT